MDWILDWIKALDLTEVLALAAIVTAIGAWAMKFHKQVDTSSVSLLRLRNDLDEHLTQADGLRDRFIEVETLTKQLVTRTSELADSIDAAREEGRAERLLLHTAIIDMRKSLEANIDKLRDIVYEREGLDRRRKP